MVSPSQASVQAFIRQERLPDTFAQIIDDWYLPLVGLLLARRRQLNRPLLVGINGAQGTGKSTLAGFLTLMLRDHSLRVANLSLDDFYLDSARRAQLAGQVHPLLASRGVPGTHDLALAREVLATLADPESRGECALPRFDKAVDEPRPPAEWEHVTLPVDVILLEGWFVGLQGEPDAALQSPVNDLEADEDPDGSWRGYVNQRLADYQVLFDPIDYLVMLRAPSFDCVYRWRSLQERKLAARAGPGASKVMDQPTLDRFIQHFERLTRHCLTSLPARADLVFHLDEAHRITHSEPTLQ